MRDALLPLAGGFLVLGAVVGGVLRWAFAGRAPEGAMPPGDGNGDVGLLETVAVAPTRETAEALTGTLEGSAVRATVSRGEDGWRVLVFPEDAPAARRAL